MASHLERRALRGFVVRIQRVVHRLWNTTSKESPVRFWTNGSYVQTTP
jgi:hypothetical protein